MRGFFHVLVSMCFCENRGNWRRGWWGGIVKGGLNGEVPTLTQGVLQMAGQVKMAVVAAAYVVEWVKSGEAGAIGL